MNSNLSKLFPRITIGAILASVAVIACGTPGPPGPPGVQGPPGAPCTKCDPPTPIDITSDTPSLLSDTYCGDSSSDPVCAVANNAGPCVSFVGVCDTTAHRCRLKLGANSQCAPGTTRPCITAQVTSRGVVACVANSATPPVCDWPNAGCTVCGGLNQACCNGGCEAPNTCQGGSGLFDYTGKGTCKAPSSLKSPDAKVH